MYPRGGPGGDATLERIGRAAAAGVGDGVGRALQPWRLGLAFAGGLLLAVLGASVLALTRSRRRLPAR